MSFESFAPSAVTTPENQLTAIEQLVQDIRAANRRVAERQRELEEAESALNRLVLTDVPEAMAAAGLAELKLHDGSTLAIKDDLKVSISQVNEKAAFAWLHEHGHGASIKENMVIDLRAGDPEVVESISVVAAHAGLTTEIKAGIHNATLKSLVREMLEKGVQPPPSISVFQFKRAIVKEPKGTK